MVSIHHLSICLHPRCIHCFSHMLFYQQLPVNLLKRRNCEMLIVVMQVDCFKEIDVCLSMCMIK